MPLQVRRRRRVAGCLLPLMIHCVPCVPCLPELEAATDEAKRGTVLAYEGFALVDLKGVLEKAARPVDTVQLRLIAVVEAMVSPPAALKDAAGL
jgi:hypothetical protein